MEKNSPKLAPHTDFGDADLTQMSMSGIDLSYCDFSKSKIDGVDFSGSNLKGSNFESCNLCNCTFQASVLDEAKLSHAELGNTNFIKALLRGADLRFLKGDFTRDDVEENLVMYPNYKPSPEYGGGYSFNGANLHSANLSGSSLNRGEFNDAILDYAIFRDAELIEASFCQSSLSHTDFTNACMPHVRIAYSHGEGTIFNNTDLNHAEIDESHLNESQFCCAHLNGAKFSFVQLTKSDFRGARCNEYEINLSHEVIYISGTQFQNSELDQANFNWAHLYGSRFTDSSNNASSFIGCDKIAAERPEE